MMDFDINAIKASFLVESQEGLDHAEQSLLAIESGAADPELLNEIFRVVHTMKGNASSLEFQELGGFAHVVEDLLDTVRSQQSVMTQETVTLLLAAIDVLRSLVAASASGDAALSDHQRELKEKIASATREQRAEGSSEASQQVSAVDKVTGPQVGGARRTLRAEVEKLDRMLDLTGEIAIAQGRMRRLLEERNDDHGREALEMHRETERLYMDLQEEIMRIRMVPVGPVFRQFVRSVRDLSQAQDKLVRLEISGDDVEVDTTILENLKDPLLHMIRNAVDHGIESPTEREARGKNPSALISLSASHSAGNIIVQIKDDGAGFNRKRIAEKAKSLGLVADADRLPDSELFQLVFRAGFSTAESVTDVSGRGVGMDVVRRNIDALHGTLSIASEEGTGSVITIRLPLTLAIIEGFSVRSGDETYIIPLEYVTECVELTEESRNSAGSDIVNLRGDALPFVHLRQVFGDHGPQGTRANLVVVKAGDVRAGIAVDTLLGATQAVIKPLAKIFQRIPEISGSTILGDGRVGLILDVPGLLNGFTTKSN
jgi:two-component system, chemotaxis family, sensor kinase CheA